MSDTAASTRRGLSAKQCTHHVAINLFKRGNSLSEAWQHFSLESLEDFTKQAKMYLKDKSNLKGSTIDGADYAELLDYFRELAEWKPSGALEATVLGEKIKVAVLSDGKGISRVHAADCEDVKRETKRFGAMAWFIEVADRQECAEKIWGDVSGDRFEEDTPQWRKACADDDSTHSRYLPCVKWPAGQSDGVLARNTDSLSLADHEAPRPKRVKKVRAALADVHVEEPQPRHRSRKTVVATATAAPVVSVSVPKRPAPFRSAPKNWLDLAKNSDTATARTWWADYCDKYARGEVYPDGLYSQAMESE
jgi:hypothetical protein